MKAPTFICKKVINCYLKLLFNFCFNKCVCGLSYKKRSNRDERKVFLYVVSHGFTIRRMLILVLYYLVSYEETDKTLSFVSISRTLKFN
jgi:hypothetical protein